MWTPDRIELAKRLWLEGKSGGEIARLLRTTRSAVIGKMHRLGLTNGRPARTNVIGVKAVAAKRPAPPRIEAPKPRPSLPPIRPIEAPPRNLTIYDLTHMDCRAIVSPDRAATALYCGHRKRPGSSFCPAHHARFHTGATHEEETHHRMDDRSRRASAPAAPEAAPANTAGRAAKARR